ncbi:MAG: tRNA (guanosine(37)-N1)-methyltransferase TrmD [Methyloligellaceae bacterium]
MTHPWQATIATLYPDMFPGPLGLSLSGQALKNEIWSLETINIRDFATDKHGSVDDRPAGGGPGMVMRADIVAAAIDHACSIAPKGAPLISLTPRGTPLTQVRVRQLSKGPGVICLCGRFEGIDERIVGAREIEELSIGDYVLSGGEIAAMVLLDAILRLLPGVVGDNQSLDEESFENDLLEYAHYTRPREWERLAIPDVLLSGDHGRIAQWRRAQAEHITKTRRPDLWKKYQEK